MAEQTKRRHRFSLVALAIAAVAVVLLVAGADRRAVITVAVASMAILVLRAAWPWLRTRRALTAARTPDARRQIRRATVAGSDTTGTDLLTSCAWVLTLGCLGCAIVDSYTSLCVDGGTLGRVGDASACFTFGGWDTRLFPLAVDMGWAGALFALIRLSRVVGFTWRWWVVFAFEILTAAFTIAGNAFHGAVADGAVGELHGLPLLVLSSITSSVPGIVAVGAGFTLSVLISTRQVPDPGFGEQDDERAPSTLAPVGKGSVDEVADLRAQLEAATAAQADVEAARTARAQAEQMLAASAGELAEVRRRADAAQAAREHAEEVLASKVEAVALLELDLAEARADIDTVQRARERADKLLASRSKPAAASRRKAAQKPGRNGAREHAREHDGQRVTDDVPAVLPVLVASTADAGVDDAREHGADMSAATALAVSERTSDDRPADASAASANGAREHDAETAEVAVTEAVPTVVASPIDAAADGAREHRSDTAASTSDEDSEPPPDDRPRGARRPARNGAREQASEVSASTSPDGPEPPPDDRPRGGRRAPRKGARERARGPAREQTARVPGDAVKAMVLDARQQLLASPDGNADSNSIAELLTARGHPISASRVRGWLAEAKREGSLGPVAPAPRLRVVSTAPSVMREAWS
jgi:hypothetical protein